MTSDRIAVGVEARKGGGAIDVEEPPGSCFLRRSEFVGDGAPDEIFEALQEFFGDGERETSHIVRLRAESLTRSLIQASRTGDEAMGMFAYGSGFRCHWQELAGP